MRGLILFVLLALLLGVFVVIGAQNDASVTVNFLIAQATLPLSTLMAIVMSIGVLIGLAILGSSWFALRVRFGLLQQKLKQYQSE